MSSTPRFPATAISPADSPSLLAHWLWLVPDTFVVTHVTAIGDAFLRDPHGSVWWLDVGDATLHLVAPNATAWQALLLDPQSVDQWCLLSLVRDLESALGPLPVGSCYTYWQCPILGGVYEPENFKIVPIPQHFAIWGPIHERLKDLPDGTKVELVIAPKPEESGA